MTAIPAIDLQTATPRRKQESWNPDSVENVYFLKDKQKTYHYSDALNLPDLGPIAGASSDTALDLRIASSSPKWRLASDMYRHALVPFVDAVRTESDFSGWQPVVDFSIRENTSGELLSKMERIRSCFAHLESKPRDREPWLLDRLLQPVTQPITQVFGLTATKWRISLNQAESPSAITRTLAVCGLIEIASDIREVEVLASEDPENMPIDLESLRHAAAFLLSERWFPSPLITLTSIGNLWLEWQISPGGLLAMNFLPSGRIQFAAVSEPPRRGVEIESVEGTMRKVDTLTAIRPFVSRLQSR